MLEAIWSHLANPEELKKIAGNAKAIDYSDEVSQGQFHPLQAAIAWHPRSVPLLSHPKTIHLRGLDGLDAYDEAAGRGDVKLLAFFNSISPMPDRSRILDIAAANDCLAIFKFVFDTSKPLTSTMHIALRNDSKKIMSFLRSKISIDLENNYSNVRSVSMAKLLVPNVDVDLLLANLVWFGCWSEVVRALKEGAKFPPAACVAAPYRETPLIASALQMWGLAKKTGVHLNTIMMEEIQDKMSALQKNEKNEKQDENISEISLANFVAKIILGKRLRCSIVRALPRSISHDASQWAFHFHLRKILPLHLTYIALLYSKCGWTNNCENYCTNCTNCKEAFFECEPVCL
jgi:hypothetical protein